MSKFTERSNYNARNDRYDLLPFRFKRLGDDEVLVSNLVGEYLFIPDTTLKTLVNHELDSTDPCYVELRAKHFLTDSKTKIAESLLPIKLRTRHKRLPEFTTLHMFVVTLRCEHSCPYCQVSRQSDDKVAFDMSEATALKSIALALRAPSKKIKIEFQGGESFLNFELIKFIVFNAKDLSADKDISFVIATNLAVVTDEILEFCKDHSIDISTSLDGPEDLHNANRPRPGKNSYQKTIEGIKRVREVLGVDHVSALMTTTKASLDRVHDIVDEYLANGFTNIFLRPLSPYGFAIRTRAYSGYDAKRWFEFYKEGLEYIIELNRQGIDFREYYTSVILKKIFTFSDPGYVDLMSPAGIGIAGIVYNYDGSVYASDESRMLAEMGDQTFKLGDVHVNSYEEIFLGDALLDPIEESFAFSAPMCNECVFENYCGADPVYHHATMNDFLGRKPESDFCARNMSVFKYLFARMRNDQFVKDLFVRWAN